MHTIKEIFTWLDCFMIPLWGVSLVDTAGSILAGSILSNTNSFVTLLFSITGLIYFIIRIHFFYKKQTIQNLVDKENLRKLQIDNNRLDDKNFIFRESIRQIPEEEMEQSKKRIK